MKTFYQLLANTLLASVINFTVLFAITFFVYIETGSLFATSLIAGIYLGLTAISGFWFGTIVDRYPKRLVMISSSLCSALFYAISFATYVVAGRDAFQEPGSVLLWVFVIVIMLGVIVGNIRTITMSTLVTVLIEEDRRDKANGLVGTTSGISFLVTSVISGLLVGSSGMYGALLFATVLTLAAAAHLLTVKFPSAPVPEHDLDKAPQNEGMGIRATWATIVAIPGLTALIAFTTVNNFLGGVYLALIDAYGLELVSVEIWGLLWGFLSTASIVGGLTVMKWGLGKNPLKAMFLANVAIWAVCSVFTLSSSVVPLIAGMYVYLAVLPYIEASEQTILQRVVPIDRQGRVFGVAQSIEQSASPLTAFLIGPIAQFVFIPFMTDGAGADAIGSWFGTGEDRGIALVFTVTGIIGFAVTLLAFGSRYYRELSDRYLHGPAVAPEPLGS